jgi:hypothetical protein
MNYIQFIHWKLFPKLIELNQTLNWKYLFQQNISHDIF